MGRSEYKKISFEERKMIEKLLDEGHCVLDIAKLLNRSNPSIYHELKRCQACAKYSAEYAQLDSIKRREGLGRKPFLEVDKELATYISELILKENLSPAEIVKRLRNKTDFNYSLSRNTIYTAIDRGLIPNVTRDTLLLKRKKTHMFSSGLIKVPKWVCEKLDLRDNQELEIDVIDGKIIITKSEK